MAQSVLEKNRKFKFRDPLTLGKKSYGSIDPWNHFFKVHVYDSISAW